MRYHTFKSSRTRNLIIADSQCRNLIFPNFNILSLPGARISHAYKFLPAKGRYNLITLFIGGNDLFDGIDNSSREPIEVAEDIAKLASKLLPLANFVYVLGIPPRGENDENTKKKAKTTNDLIQVERKGRSKAKRTNSGNTVVCLTKSTQSNILEKTLLIWKVKAWADFARF